MVMSGATRKLTQYAVAAALVRLADEGARVGLALLSLQRLNSAAVGGLLVAALLVPHVLAASLVGMVVDRSARPAFAIAAGAAAFGAALLSATAFLGRIHLAVVMVVLIFGGCCGPALTGGLSSLLGRLVPNSKLPRAFGIDSLTYNVAGVVGPAVVAVLAGATTPAVAVGVLAGSAGLGAVLIAALPINGSDTLPSRGDVGVLAGLKVIANDRVLATVTWATSVGQVGAGALPVFLVVIADRAHIPALAGLLLAATAVGGLLGSLVWTWRPAQPRRSPAVVMAGLVGIGVPVLAGATVASSPPVLAVLFGLSGIATGPLFGALLTVRQDRAPVALRGQVFTLGAGVKITATAAGAALAGAAVSSGTSTQLALAASVPMLAGVFGAVALRRRCRPVDMPS